MADLAYFEVTIATEGKKNVVGMTRARIESELGAHAVRFEWSSTPPRTFGRYEIHGIRLPTDHGVASLVKATEYVTSVQQISGP